MKKDNINYLMVGVFVIATLLLLFAMLYRITGQQSGAEVYYVEFDKITGIKDGAAVTYEGYQIGQVNSVEPVFGGSRTRYKMQLSIKGGWPIPADSIAEIAMPGIIADKQIEITEGQSKNRLQPGDLIASREAVDMMALASSIGNELDNFVPNMAGDISNLLKKLNHSASQIETMLDDENIQHIDNMFLNADDASKSLAKLASGFDKVNHQLDELLKRSSALVADNDEDIRHSVLALKKSMDVISSHINSIVYNLDASSRNMNELSRQLRDNPGAILGSKPPVDNAVPAK
ncbi:MAG: MlaD family protein [Gammaproteobacteria bacterium]|nr:MlaD family protein [Gammaproteobacteria bacterium]